jgi:hypothetical protein
MQVRTVVGGRGDTYTQPSGSFEGRQLAVGVHGTEQGAKKVGLGRDWVAVVGAAAVRVVRVVRVW